MAKKEQRSSFIFYSSFYDAIKLLDNEDKMTTYEAIIEYGLTGVVPNITGVPLAIFTLIKPQLDASWTRYMNGCSGGRKVEKKEKSQTPKIGKQVKPDNAPTRYEVITYFANAGESAEEANHFFDHFESLGWKNANGVKVIRWDSKANEWILKTKKDARNKINNQSNKSASDPNNGAGCGLKRKPNSI